MLSPIITSGEDYYYFQLMENLKFYNVIISIRLCLMWIIISLVSAVGKPNDRLPILEFKY